MKLKNKLFIFLFFFTIAITIVSFVFGSLSSRRMVYQLTDVRTSELEQRFKNKVNVTTNYISSALNVLTENQEIKDVFSQRNRNALYEKALPLFEKIKRDSEITHFYFILPDGHCFLRMHDPATFDDVIERPSFLEAVQTQQFGSGIELGKNVFAIRVVRPYYNGEELLGYVEFSKEIGTFLEEFGLETADELYLYGGKEYLSHADWSAIRQKRGLVDNWNELPRNVLISDTGSIELRNACFNGIDPDTFLKDPGLLHEFSFNGDQYTCSGFHILNRANQGVATLVIIQNVNQFLAIGQGLLLSESTIISIVFLIFVFLLVVLINRTVLAPVQSLVSASRKIAAGSYGEKSNFRSNDEIGKLTENFNGMSEKLAKNYQQLKENGDLLSGQVKIISEKNAELRAQEERLEKTLGKLDKKNNELHILTHDLEKFKLALDNASDYVTITDPEAKILYLNSAAKAVSATCQVGEDVRHMWQGLMGQAFIDRLWRTIKYDKKNFTSDLLTMTEAGKELEVRLSITPIVDENGAVIFFVSICRDISEEKAVEKAKSDFVSLTSHQLRTPLTSIKWLIELLLNPKNGKLNRKQRDFLKTAYASTKRLMFLIGDLLSVSHIETGKINLNTKLTSIGTVLKSILQDLEPQISSKELAVSLKLAKNVPEISVDNNLIKQALTNIISNSVKYTPEKGKVGISTKKAGESLVIEITDNGLGIPQEEQKDIFKRFFRASNVQTEFTDGTGLGLFISQSLVGLSGGTISFQSTVGKGTTFWVTLPLNQNPVQ